MQGLYFNGRCSFYLRRKSIRVYVAVCLVLFASCTNGRQKDARVKLSSLRNLKRAKPTPIKKNYQKIHANQEQYISFSSRNFIAFREIFF